MIRFTMVIALFLVMAVAPAIAGTSSDESTAKTCAVGCTGPEEAPEARPRRTRSTLERWRGGPRAGLRVTETSLPAADPSFAQSASSALIQAGGF